MNDPITLTQLWAAFALPTLVSLLAIVLNHRGMNRLIRRFNSIESHLDQLSPRHPPTDH